jgi:hypothetical protein
MKTFIELLTEYGKAVADCVARSPIEGGRVERQRRELLARDGVLAEYERVKKERDEMEVMLNDIDERLKKIIPLPNEEHMPDCMCERCRYELKKHNWDNE